MLNLSSAKALAAKSIARAQQGQRDQYNRHTNATKLRVGGWILMHFPQDETGKQRKLSRPWHGPYRIISRNDSDVTAVKIFFQMGPPIQVHQSRVNKCPLSFPNNFYWYGGRRSKPGRPNKRIAKQLETVDAVMRCSTDNKEENACAESGNATRILSEHQEEFVTSDSTVNISSDSMLSTSPTPKITRSSDVTTSDQDQRSSTETTM